MRTLIQVSLVTMLLVVFGACSSSDDSSKSAASALEAPELTAVTPMTGALHLTWTNHQHDCNSVEAERKDATADFAVIFSVPGDVDNKMDGSATDPNQTYTYRLRCKKGSGFSGYSNEMSASP